MEKTSDEMVRKIEIVGELHMYGVELMRRRLVAAHGEAEGTRRLRAWKLADHWQGPGVATGRVLEQPSS